MRASTIRLRELQRGERIAVATDKTQALRQTTPSSGLSALKDAEATLAKLRSRQKQIDATAAAMDEMDQSGDPLAITQKLAEAGCGMPVRTTADAGSRPPVSEAEQVRVTLRQAQNLKPERTKTMTTTTNYAPKDSGAWKMFTVASFGVAAALMAGGIYFLEASFAAKGFYAMAAIMLVHTSVTITKTLRDEQESNRFINKLEDAKTEKLLMDIHRNDNL